MTDDPKTSANAGEMPGWAVERLYPDYRQCLEIGRMLYDSETAHQRIRVFENPRFGRVLTLDGVVQTTTSDEFIYHEMLAHVPIFAHGQARRVLIIGGGDGGMAREALRHSSVEHVTMVEIDAGVVEFSKKYLPSLSAGAFDDARLDLVIADGAEFVATTDRRFDVAIVDSTDPVGPGEVLFTDTFYGRARRCLDAGGILVTQNGVPFMQGTELAGTMRAFRALFADAACYLASVPTYVGGPMAFGWGTDGRARTTPPETLRARFEASGIATRYYTPEVHAAAFAGSFFMVPAAVTAFSRANLSGAQLGPAIALFTVVFSVGQIVGPVAAGALSDRTGDTGAGLAAGAAILLAGGAIALAQRSLARP